MSFLVASVAKQLGANMTTTVAQALTPSKKEVSALSSLVRDNTRKYWKPLVAVGTVGALAYGAYKVRTEILQQKSDTEASPTPTQVRNLTHTADSVDGNCGPERGDFDELDALADELLEELQEQPELEDCLENDPAASADTRWTDAESELAIIQHKIDAGKAALIGDEYSHPTLELQKCIIVEESYRKQQYRKQRKRVRSGQLSNATRGLAAKIRASFPLPEGSMLQQKAMCLYAAKECRKMCIREAQIAVMVPKAVALASIPTTSQVDLRQITQIDAVQLRYRKMAWSGFKNKQGWAAHLASLFA